MSDVIPPSIYDTLFELHTAACIHFDMMEAVFNKKRAVSKAAPHACALAELASEFATLRGDLAIANEMDWWAKEIAESNEPEKLNSIVIAFRARFKHLSEKHPSFYIEWPANN